MLTFQVLDCFSELIFKVFRQLSGFNKWCSVERLSCNWWFVLWRWSRYRSRLWNVWRSSFASRTLTSTKSYQVLGGFSVLNKWWKGLRLYLLLWTWPNWSYWRKTPVKNIWLFGIDFIVFRFWNGRYRNFFILSCRFR